MIHAKFDREINLTIAAIADTAVGGVTSKRGSTT
jgi:hypothetical protein